MKSDFFKKEWPQLLILIAPLVFIAVEWNQIPDHVPTHWGMSGRVNGYTDKGFGLFLLPAINIGLAALLFSIAKIDPKAYKMNLPSTAMKPIRLIISGFISVLICYSILLGIGNFEFNGSAMNIGMGVLFLLIGNYLPRIKPNYFVGVRTPWALENPENWRLTHIFAGKLWVAASIIYIAAQFFIHADAAESFFIFYLFAIILPPFVYSYLIFQKSKRA